MYKLYNGDCLEVMDRLIEEGVKVDCILCDPPYGTTACKWDTIIPFTEMWDRLNKLIKPNGAIALFGNEPFSSSLRMSNIKNYKYDWIWNKGRGTDFLNAKRKPLSSYENICIFYTKLPTYNPQFWFSTPYDKGIAKLSNSGMQCYGETNDIVNKSDAMGIFYTNATYPVTATGAQIEDLSKLKQANVTTTNILFLIETSSLNPTL